MESSSSSPFVPGFAKFGTWRVGVAKWLLPQPPRPPRAITWGSSPERFRHQAARFRIAQKRAAGHGDHEVFALFAAAPFAAPVSPAPGRIFALVAEIGQSGKIIVHLEDDVAAAAAVSAVRSAGSPTYFSRRKETAPFRRHPP